MLQITYLLENVEIHEIEECPKWKVLSEVLEEIKSASASAGIDGATLIAANDDRTCSQLREYLGSGGAVLLGKLYERSFGSKEESVVGRSNAKKGRNIRKRQEKESEDDFSIQILPNSVTIIHPLKGNSDPYSLMKSLTELEPRYIVMYDTDMEFVRQIEVFKASRPNIQLRVYFIIYSGSVEEQRYLTTLRKEKEAFELLIKQKAVIMQWLFQKNEKGKRISQVICYEMRQNQLIV